MKARIVTLAGRHDIFLGVWIVTALVTLKVMVGDAIKVALPIFMILCVLATIFPILYAITSRGFWRFSQPGRTMMTQGVVMALLLDFSLAQYFLGLPETFMLYVSIALYTCLALVKVSLIRMVLHNRIPSIKRLKKERA